MIFWQSDKEMFMLAYLITNTNDRLEKPGLNNLTLHLKKHYCQE